MSELKLLENELMGKIQKKEDDLLSEIKGRKSFLRRITKDGIKPWRINFTLI